MTAFSDAAARLKKPRPKLLNKRDAKAKVSAEDRAENAKVRSRSGGQCEIFVVGKGRCERRAVHTHHILKGWGRRARGASLLAENKLAICATCHTELHGRVLVAEGLEQDKAFRRVK